MPAHTYKRLGDESKTLRFSCQCQINVRTGVTFSIILIMPIHLLSSELVSQIAAGEVVERPASVIKELVENALDADASTISIHIERGGLESMEVADDGRGIDYDEVSLALTRHATSKLNNSADLFNIQTLGFRGEALASIGSVSRLTLVSRTNKAEYGASITCDGGEVGVTRAVGVPAGTVVRVSKLFFNVPPRLAFLKTTATEKSRINDLVFRYALAYPHICWQLFQDQKPILRTSGNGDCREILAVMYGIAVSKDMIELNLSELDIHISGFISPTQITRSNRRDLTFFVNGRWVMDAGLSASLLQAYAAQLPPQRYPIAVVKISINPSKVDVNVHPAKAEVRFRDNNLVFTTLQRAVRRAFMAFTPPSVDCADQPGDVNNPSNDFSRWKFPGGESTMDPAWTLAALMKQEEQTSAQSTGETSQATESQTPLISIENPLLRLIGELRERYLLVEGPDGLYLIDECTAWEQIVYEQYLHALSSQILKRMDCENSYLFPVEDGLQKKLPMLERIGILFEEFGPTTVRLREIPDFLHQTNMKPLFTGLLTALKSVSAESSEELTEWAVARIAQIAGEQYHSHGNRTLQEQLLSNLQACASPRQTADGRATMIHLSIDLLNRQFGRT